MVSTLNSSRRRYWLHNKYQTSLRIIQHPCNVRGASRRWCLLPVTSLRLLVARCMKNCENSAVSFATSVTLYARLKMRIDEWLFVYLIRKILQKIGQNVPISYCNRTFITRFVHLIENIVRESWNSAHLNRRELLPQGFWAVRRRVDSASSRVSERKLK